MEGANKEFTAFFKTTTLTNVPVKKLRDYLYETGQAFNFAALKATVLNATLNVAIVAGLSLLIKGIAAGINYFYKTQKELDDIAEDSATKYESAKTDLEEVNSELEQNNSNIQAIKDKGILSYTDQEELEKLQKANAQLQTQITLKEQALEKDREKAALDAIKAANFGNKYDYSEEDRDRAISKIKFGNEDQSQGEINIDYATTNDASLNQLMASYEILNAKLNTVQTKTKEWLNTNNQIDDVSQKISDRLSGISDYLSKIEPEYDSIINKEKNGKFISFDEQKIKDQYEEYFNIYNDIFQQIYPDEWNNIQFDKIFNIEGIELTKQELIQLAKDGSLNDLDLSQYQKLEEAINNASISAKDGEDSISSFKNQINALSLSEIESYDPMAFADDTAMDSTISTYDRLADSLTNLADLQEALGESFTLSADQARYFADIYPEILSMGEITSEGLLQLNADQANSFIESKAAMAKTDSEQRIQELEAAKAVLTGLKLKAETELEIANQVANGEMSLEEGMALAKSKVRQNLTQYLMDLGVDEVTAQKAASEAQAGNVSEFSRVVADVSNTNYSNLSNSAGNAAADMKDNSENMATSLDGVGNTASRVAQQIAHLSSGKSTYVGKAYIGGGKAGSTGFSASNVKGIFKGVDAPQIEATYTDPEEWIKDLEFDITKYTDAIAGIDSQINLLKAANLGNLSDFSSGKYSPKSGSGNGKDKSEKEFSKTFDWITNAINKLESKIKKLGNVVSNVYKGWKDRNSALNQQITSLVDEVQLQGSVYATYMGQANSIGLSDYYKDLVQNGALSIETITDENLANRIEEYQQYYDNALQASEKLQSLEKDLSDAFATKFENITKEYDDQLSTIEFKMQQLNKIMEMVKNKGFTTSTNFYTYLIEQTLENIKVMEKEKSALQHAVNEAVESGTMEVGSEKWYELTQKILDVESALTDANASLIDFGNSMRDIEWELFDHLQDTISQVTTESDFLISLLEKKKLVSDNGDLTDEGNAMLGLHGVNYNTYMQQSDEYAKSIKQLDEQYKNDSLNNDYLERRQELVELQQKSIQNAEDEKEAMADLAKQGYQKMIDSLKEMIDKRKEWLQTEKDLYNYQKEIAQRTKEIAQIEKQLGAYGNDNSEETNKTVQELKNQLQEAKDNLQDTEYDRYIADQEALLDKLYEEAELWLNERFDNIDQWFGELIDQVNANSGQIGSTLTETTNNLGYTLSGAMQTIFGTNTDKVIGSNNGVQNTITKYGEQFGNQMTTLQTAINSIKANIQSMVDKANIEAEKAKQEAEKKAQEANRPSTGSGNSSSSGSGSSKPSGSGSGGGNGNSGSALKSIFVSKKDYYPKNQLNRYTSIVDALKYYDFDSSFARCEEYFRRLGGGGTYVGSYAQNTWMLGQFRNIMGYRKGGIVGDLQTIAKGNGDDMVTINTLKRGEGIIPLEMMPAMTTVVNGMPTLAKAMEEVQNKRLTTFGEMNNVYLDNLSVILPNVKDYQGLRKELLNDKAFMKVFKSEIASDLGVGTKLNKNRYK